MEASQILLPSETAERCTEESPLKIIGIHANHTSVIPPNPQLAATMQIYSWNQDLLNSLICSLTIFSLIFSSFFPLGTNDHIKNNHFCSSDDHSVRLNSSTVIEAVDTFSIVAANVDHL